ncbi:DUF4129 domain-containing protein [Sulfuriroseicoccus oceanibius]|uniref:Uncharacterized protein n=1 Tax=Sulfuriroseicoccus oceanibius TaxID=2707525 RepID=A0A6B3LC52_9BACT|nr:DUF4129 domain-containing protein [Sulfuriroseicoccus oceanibius]QQL45694.1 hypothetical protein G3M56_003640 [Sulfuriroseicoccus oceanibius]
MNLFDINAVMRPRRTLEAVDLGVALVRRFAKPVFGAWALTVLPLWLMMAAVLWNYPGWALFAIWFTKPLMDRVPLYVISRGLFGEVPPIREVVRAFPRMLVRNVFALTIANRMSMCGALLLPVVDLEGAQEKKARKERIQAIRRVGSGAGSVMWVFSLIESSMLIGLLIVGQMLLPEFLADEFSMGMSLLLEYSDPTMLVPLLQVVLVGYIVAVSLVEPFYVGGGFGVYVNVRSIMEGWDIELEFRKLGARLSEQMAPVSKVVGGSRSALIGLFAALLFGLSGVGSGMGQSWDEGEWTARDSKELAQQVSEEDAFEVKTVKIWKPDEPEKRKRESFDASPLAGLAKVGFWCVVVAVVGFVLWLMIRAAARWKGSVPDVAEPEDRRAVESFLGMPVRPESLPDDVVTEARRLWNEQKFVEAMGLLYRAGIGWMIEQGHVEIRESDTEGDCLRRIESELPGDPRVAFFRSLTNGWMATVYAGLIPEAPEFEQWCDQWPYRRDVAAGMGGAK